MVRASGVSLRAEGERPRILGLGRPASASTAGAGTTSYQPPSRTSYYYDRPRDGLAERAMSDGLELVGCLDRLDDRDLGLSLDSAALHRRGDVVAREEALERLSVRPLVE